MRSGKKGKLSPRFIEPYQTLWRIGKVAYELELPSGLELVNQIFHISMLQKCIGDILRLSLLRIFRSQMSCPMRKLSCNIRLTGSKVEDQRCVFY